MEYLRKPISFVSIGVHSWFQKVRRPDPFRPWIALFLVNVAHYDLATLQTDETGTRDFRAGDCASLARTLCRLLCPTLDSCWRPVTRRVPSVCGTLKPAGFCIGLEVSSGVMYLAWRSLRPSRFWRPVIGAETLCSTTPRRWRWSLRR